jgi:aminopeptidase N
MKKLIIVLTLFCQYYTQAQTSAPLTQFDITSYSADLELFDEHDTIDVGVIIRYQLINPGCKEIILDLDGFNAQTGKGMKVQTVTCAAVFGGITFRQTDRHVIIPTQTDKTKQWFYIGYKGVPANGMIISKNKFGDRTFFSDNWPDRAAHWLPCVNHPADKASFYWNVEVPQYYTVTANGELTMEVNAPVNRKVWTFIQEEPIPVKVAAVGVAKFNRTLSATVNCVPVYKYYYPETDYNKYYQFDSAVTILKFYSQLIGEYPFKKLSNVQSTTMFGGMENAGNIFYDEERVDGNNSIEALIAHEMAHQWFGNSVTEKSYAHIWLSEGFATFLTNYYLEKKYGTDTLKKRLAADWQSVARFSANNARPVIDTTSNYMSLLSPNSYQKGGLFLQTLREKLGDKTFFTVIRKFYQEYKFKNADTNDFRLVVEKVTRQSWKSFFEDWLYQPVLPGKYKPRI